LKLHMSYRVIRVLHIIEPCM